ncbi:MAG: FG-GAP repeat protein [Anaerolineales bacterium]|nr:FG-GAP repeat protein [Anaerolineales bacterium]
MKHRKFLAALLISLLAFLAFNMADDAQATTQAFGNSAIQTPSEVSISAVFHPQIARLAASDPEGGDSFGSSLAIDGDTLVVGAFNEDGAGTNRGAVYIFERDQGGLDNWGQVKK